MLIYDNQNKNILSGGAVAFLLCLLLHAVPLPLCAAGTLASEENGSGNQEKVLQRSLLCLRADRVTYQEGFFYESLSDAVKERLPEFLMGRGVLFPMRSLNICRCCIWTLRDSRRWGKSYVTR